MAEHPHLRWKFGGKDGLIAVLVSPLVAGRGSIDLCLTTAHRFWYTSLPSMANNKFWTIYLPDEVRSRYARIAKKSGMSRSALVRDALELWAREDKRKRARRAARRT